LITDTGLERGVHARKSPALQARSDNNPRLRPIGTEETRGHLGNSS